jgi:DNA-binding transcriptional regulator YiaG
MLLRYLCKYHTEVIVPNFAGTLKSEIRRLARKEVRASVMPLRKLVAGLRKRVAQQRRLINDLGRTARRAVNTAHAPQAAASEESQIRFSPEWVKAHRKKLKMSRRVYAKLIGVSAQSIFGWETGRTRPRRRALESWRKIRSMGLRELKALPGAGKSERRGRRGKPGKRGKAGRRGKPARGGRPGRRGRPAAAARGRRRRAVARTRRRAPSRRVRRAAKKK